MSLNTTTNKCPFRHDYNPFQSPQLEDPYLFYARARQETPVFYSPMLDMWVVTRYDDICKVVQDPVRFSSKNSVRIPPNLPPEVQEILQGFELNLPLINHDPPLHTRLRNAINKAFSRQAIATMEPQIKAIAHELIDNFVDDGHGELIAQFANLLPLKVITTLLGVPRQDEQLFKQWSDDWGMLLWGNLPLEEQIRCAHSYVAFQKYIADAIAQRQRLPQNDLLTRLVEVFQEDEYPLSMPEIATILMGLLFAGHETTTKLICNTLLLLLRHPEQWSALQKDLGLSVNVVEESLRMDTPTQGMCRITTEAVEIGGVTIPAGARLQLIFASANRDPSHFPDPDRFDIHRTNRKQHFGFGGGIHICPGAFLARLECQIAIEVLTQRLPSLRLRSDSLVEYEPNIVLRGPKHLFLEWQGSGTGD